jgi:hypothetical protein
VASGCSTISERLPLPFPFFLGGGGAGDVVFCLPAAWEHWVRWRSHAFWAAVGKSPLVTSFHVSLLVVCNGDMTYKCFPLHHEGFAVYITHQNARGSHSPQRPGEGLEIQCIVCLVRRGSRGGLGRGCGYCLLTGRELIVGVSPQCLSGCYDSGSRPASLASTSRRLCLEYGGAGEQLVEVEQADEVASRRWWGCQDGGGAGGEEYKEDKDERR